MKKIDLAQTIMILADIGVIAGIVFLAVEIRQNTAATRSATIQDIARWSFDNVSLETTNADLRTAIRANCAGTDTPDQRQLLHSYYVGMMRIQMNRFLQSDLGTIDEQTALAIGGTGGPYTRPFFAEFWSNWKESAPAEFRSFVEAEILPNVRDSCEDRLIE